MDLLEISLTTHLPPSAVLEMAPGLSGEAYTVTRSGRPEIMFGVHITDGLGLPWMMGSVYLDFIPKRSVKEARSFVKRWRSYGMPLVNQALERNETHRKWLRLAGFRETSTFQNQGYTFIRFEG